jgi:lipoic acid synthetase
MATIHTRPHKPRPSWLKVKSPLSQDAHRTKKILGRWKTNTVCREARCPNIGECFSAGTATFMILGDICTRNCGFCSVTSGKPKPPDETEPESVASAAADLGLRHVVLTSVTRDDLKDGGAGHFAACAEAIKRTLSQCTIEFLVPDFNGGRESVEIVAGAAIDVLGHNLETVPRLYEEARPGADYASSLSVLEACKEFRPDLPTKSGLMIGLGEKAIEVKAVMRDLRQVGCDFLTLGQYLQPTTSQLPVQRYICPVEFQSYEKLGRSMGFKRVLSGPLVRSSYRAAELISGRDANLEI